MAKTKKNKEIESLLTEKKNEKPVKTEKSKKSKNKKSENRITTIEANAYREKSEKPKKQDSKSKVRIIPLGGVDRIGMNMTVFEYEDDIIIVDAGMSFPQEDMPGVEVVIPDFSYLLERADKIRGLILTHGHEDHIGAVPYLLKKIPCDVFGTRLTLGIVDGKLLEHDIDTDDLFEVRAGEVLQLGAFEVEFIHVNHSMPDSVALCINTPCGRIIHTGDFKIDYTPTGTTPIDLNRFSELGKKGVKLLMADSTNVERPGYTPSEQMLTASFDRIFSETQKRIVFSTFASNVHRIQQILEASRKWGRKVAITGRSMQNVLRAAEDLGYIQVPDGLMIDISDVKYFLPEELTILTTGTQGEPMSALHRMAFGAHPMISLNQNDLVILSASCIPGNERFVNRIINELYRKKVEVITDRTDDVHVSGHACREELKLIHNLIHAENFVPLHGEYRHLAVHAKLAQELGTKESHVLIPEIGHVIEMDKKGIRFAETVEAGPVMIDSGISDGVESAVLRDRNNLAGSGIVFVACLLDRDYGIAAGPDLVTKGFVYVKENEELLAFLRDRAARCINRCLDKGIEDLNTISSRVKDDLQNAIFEKTKRKPVIATLINYID